MNFIIYSIGDSEFLEQILIALALISSVNDFPAMVQVGMAVGVFGTIISAVAKGGKEIEFQHVLLGYILWATMFVPTVQVTIEDSYTGDLRIVNNVPIGPAAAGGIISLVGYKLTELFEVAYGPTIPKVTDTEFAESLRILNDIRHKASSNSVWRGLNLDAGGGFIDLRKSWTNYIKDCTLKKVDLGLMSPDELVTDVYIDAIEFQSELFGTRIYNIPGDADGVDLNCTDAFAQLDADTVFGNNTVDSFNGLLGLNSNNLAAGQSSQTKTQNALDALLGAGINSQTYMEVAVLEPIMMRAASGKYDQLQDLAGASMINQAIQQRNTTWAAEQSLFMTIVRPMLAFFEAFIYSVSPIMAFVIVLGAKGIQLAAKYFTMLIWIQLWMPLLSVVNLYIYTSSSRQLSTYGAMTGHNWDSFYALHTAADTAQTWIATGGLLASSTPAIALMLIYGSAVTATHLAGRLRSDTDIDSKYETPDLKNNGPLANVGSRYAGDALHGLQMNGTQGAIGTATVSSALSNTTKSSQAMQNAETQQFSSDLSNSINSSSSAGSMMAKAKVAGAAARSGHSTISQNAVDHAQGFMAQHKIDQSHAESITGMAALSAGLGANLDVDKAAGYIAGATGVARAAAKKFLQDAGAASKPGKGLAVVKGGKGDSGGGDDLIDIKASARADASARSAEVDQTQSNFGHQAQSSDGYSELTQDQAQYAQELSSQISRQDQQSFQKSWGSSDAQSVRTSASELVSASQSYETAQSLQTALSSASSLDLRTVGALAAGRDTAGFSGDSSAQDTLNSGWHTQPESVKSHAQQLENRYASWGMQSDVAQNTARLTALTDPNNFKDNPSGHLGATMLAGEVIRQATGHGGNNTNYNYDQNSDLQQPSHESGDIQKQTEGLATPDISPMNSIRNETSKAPASVYAEQGNLDTGQLAENHSANVSNVNSAGAEKEGNLISKHEAQYRSGVLNSSDVGTAATMMGSWDNTTGWIGRKAEQIAGGSEAFINEFGNGVGEAYEAYRNMTPEDASALRQSIQQQDAALFDSLGIAGLPVKGAQMVGNEILGATVAGVDAYRGGSDLSEAAQGLSTQERGAFFAAAAGEAASDGTESFAAFMGAHGAEFKQTMGEVGQHQYGLTPKQSAIFAESYDTNSSSMRAKVMDFQEDYAIRDGNGAPMRDESTGEWKMTPENREFTDAVVNRITAATGAGDRVGSYLESVAGYNIATGQNR